ncbi:MAG TPA: helix-turn-helix domain-containing protein [Burkholderiaceae bacterium]|nr:helix-turn-helix domain-containing protein [Burkholderiaceae bacterium]
MQPATAAADACLVRFADLAAGLGAPVPANPRIAEAVFNVRRLSSGEAVYHAGDKFETIYLVRAGFFKTVRFGNSGSEQVLGFPMAGDVIGLDAADLDEYATDVIALDTSGVVVIPFGQLARFTREDCGLQHLVHSLFSREVVRRERVIALLGTLGAEARVAAFLLYQSESFGKLGYSPMSFQLRMTRQDVGNYLGLKLETVSRIFSAFAAAGLLDVRRRWITLHDLDALRAVGASHAETARRRRAAAVAPAGATRLATGPAPSRRPRASLAVA